jgi:D-3-phosphoglycerate dehydrogenase
MHVCIADSLADNAIRELERIGCSVRYDPSLGADDLPDAVRGVNVLVVRSTRVTGAVFEAADELALVVRAGAGVNTIDLETAGRRGVFVANCPGRNAHAVAELTIGLIIAADRGIADATGDLRAGRWRKKHYGRGYGLRGRTLGVLGFGTIGSLVASYGRSLGMKPIVWRRSLDAERAAECGVAHTASPLEVAERADVVTVHLASTSETRGIINEAFLASMRRGSILVNTARGDLIDPEALVRAIRERDLRVALDVYDGEPGGGDDDFTHSELASLVTGTPHIGASTVQASEAIAAETVRVIAAYKESGVPLNVVNVSIASGATHTLVVRHLNRVGVLAGVLDSLRENGVNVEEMTNTIFSGGEAAGCSLRLDAPPDDETLARIRSQTHVLMARVEEIAPTP